MSRLDIDSFNFAKAEHADELRRVQKVLRYQQGFQLIFCLYTDPPTYRESIITFLNHPFKKPNILHTRTLDNFSSFEELLARTAESADIIHVIGLDAWLLGEQAQSRLQAFNQRRESIAQCCTQPLILWLPEHLAKDFALFAPDCWEWRRIVADFSYLAQTEVTPVSYQQGSFKPSVLTEDIQLPKDWGHARFLLEQNSIKENVAAGELKIALLQAETLLAQALKAGEEAYHGADYDIAIANFLFAGTLQRSGFFIQALEILESIFLDFKRLANNGAKSALKMLQYTLVEQGNCLKDTGRLEAAVDKYQEAMHLAKKLNDIRLVATAQAELAGVFILQKQYAIALSLYEEAQELFMEIGNSSDIATTFHQTGIVYAALQEHELAEQAYRQALSLTSNKIDVINSLNQLGNLYHDWGKLEEAIQFFQEAVQLANELGDLLRESVARNNTADSLIELQRYDDAREELQLAKKCQEVRGIVLDPWVAWVVLYKLEQACNNKGAANAAKQQAIYAYLAYRRMGGVNIDGAGVTQLCKEVLSAIHENKITKAVNDLKKLQQSPELAEVLIPVIPKLIAILQGERQRTLIDDPELDYNSAAELLFLLERLIPEPD
ncbi:MAG: tetratricopeptide repeat protein [Methyloprofundus sp.]|nr:tetratricopeptide repeat protein [Methyloprofundus sp.]